MYLIKLKSGMYSPMDSSDHDESKKIPVGEAVKATRARNVGFHKKMMALFNLGFSNQDRFKNLEMYRYIKTKQAGFIIDDGGEQKAESLSFESMGQERAEKVFNAVLDIISEDLQTAPEDIRAEVEGYY